MYEDRNQYQIIRKDARNCFVESLSDAFSIGKAHLAFATYDLSQPVGQRQTNNIHIYMDIPELLELCRKMSSGEMRFMIQQKKKADDKTPLALLTYICRLWPILLLIILGIFIAAMRLLFLSSKKVSVIEPLPLLPEPTKTHTEKDVRDMAYAVILKRITELVTAEYPCARWVWEYPNSKHLIEKGENVFILLNRAGGYRRAKVSISNLQVTGLEYQAIPMQGMRNTDQSDDTTDALDTDESKTSPDANYEFLAFEWVDANLIDLNKRCNEAIGSGLDEFVIPAEELPVKESWEDICRELKRNGLEDTRSIPEGIIINLKQ